MSKASLIRTFSKFNSQICPTAKRSFCFDQAKGRVGRQQVPIRNLFVSATASQTEFVFKKWDSYEIEPGVRCNSICKEANNGKLLDRPLPHPNVNTVWDLFENGLSINPNGKCLGWREGSAYKWWTYTEVAQRASKVAGGLAALGIPRQSCVGFYSQSIPQWVVAFLGCISRSLIVVPLYDTLGQQSSSFIINQTEMPLLFVDTSVAARRILEKADSTPQLRTIVTFTEPEKEVVELARAKKVSLLTLEKLSSSGNVIQQDLPKPEDFFAVMYTSGTTGVPKGVLHTHRSLQAGVTGINSNWLRYASDKLYLTKDEITLHYAPFAHVLGVLNVLGYFYFGAAIGFYSGNILKLVEDAAILKPTQMTMVPRLMNRIYSSVLSELSKSKVKSAIFWSAYRRKKAMLDRGIITRNSIWDKLVFKKIQNILGGRLWIIAVGSAPLTADVLEFWRVVLACQSITECYGQTETSGGVTSAAHATGSNVGHPLPCNLIKLVDVPECGYFVNKGGRGEICVKGHNVMKGYFKEPEKTAEVFDEDGWLHTGDIGEFLPDGTLKIVDRKKNLFKLAQGVYIAPDKVESVYLLCPQIFQVFVDGISSQDFAVAIVVPDPVFCSSYAAEHKVESKSLMTNKQFIEALFKIMIAVGKKNGLNSLEQVKAIHLTSDPFTIANGLLTPTMKNKRSQLRNFFQGEMETLYKTGPFPSSKN